MKLNELLVSNVHISEDEYASRGSFTLTAGGHILQLDLVEFESGENVREIRDTLALTESVEEIRKYVLDQVISHSSLSSRNSGGENYQESLKRKKQEKAASKLDRA